jgi:hypothetical protein
MSHLSFHCNLVLYIASKVMGKLIHGLGQMSESVTSLCVIRAKAVANAEKESPEISQGEIVTRNRVS